jgi:hypothetical protein
MLIIATFIMNVRVSVTSPRETIQFTHDALDSEGHFSKGQRFLVLQNNP